MFLRGPRCWPPKPEPARSPGSDSQGGSESPALSCFESRAPVQRKPVCWADLAEEDLRGLFGGGMSNGCPRMPRDVQPSAWREAKKSTGGSAKYGVNHAVFGFWARSVVVSGLGEPCHLISGLGLRPEIMECSYFFEKSIAQIVNSDSPRLETRVLFLYLMCVKHVLHRTSLRSAWSRHHSRMMMGGVGLVCPFHRRRWRSR